MCCWQAVGLKGEIIPFDLTGYLKESLIIELRNFVGF
jgi:hypothetical protein